MLTKKTIETLGEFGLIDEIKRWLPRAKAPVIAGIGDDTAVFKISPTRYQLLTIDTIVEDIDFKKSQAKPEEIGWKSLAINLSDIAAMGGVPKFAAVSLTLPKKTPVPFVKKFYAGMRKLADQFGVSIVGGDLSGGSKISISVALLGESEKKYTTFRKGARSGDFIAVSGRLGGSLLGKHLNFTPRVREGELVARQGASSMIDVSDGLWQDLGHLTTESGLSFVIEPSKIPVSNAALKRARGNRDKAILHALYDGEDFELLFTISAKRFLSLRKAWRRRFSVPLTAIGKVVNREKTEAKLFRKRLGFQHF
jgi:thiamine-monophosphate kinase